MKKQIIQTILMLLLFILIVIACKEIIAANIDVDESGASEAKFYKDKSLAGIYNAMKEYKNAWVNLDTSNVSLEGYGGEALSGGQAMIHSIGALCFGHATKNNDNDNGTSISEKISIIDIDYNSSPRELKLAYMAYQSRIKEEKNNATDSPWKNRIRKWLYTYSRNYGIQIQSKGDTTNNYNIEEVKDYAKKMYNREFEVKKIKTNNIKTDIETTDDYTYIGPIKVKVDQFPITGYSVAIGGNKIEGNKYTTVIGDGAVAKEIKELEQKDSYQTIYLRINKQNITDKTKVSVTFTQKINPYYKAKIVISQPNLRGGQNICIFRAYKTSGEETKTITFEATESAKYAIKIRKVDENGKPLSGVGFIFRWSDKDSKGNDQILPTGKDYNGRFLKSNANREISYEEVDEGNNMANATVFYTDSKGYITVSGLSLAGNYKAIEWKNPYPKYEVFEINEEGEKHHISVDGIKAIEEDEITNNDATKIVNTPQYITIEGNVWEDTNNGKQSKRNNLLDDKEERLKNVRVYLKDKKGTILNNTDTDENGYYSFETIKIDNSEDKIRIDQLKEYHIEFEYNGLGYEAVKKFEKSDNYSIVSVAEEGDNRTKLNNKCLSVTAGNSNNQVKFNYSTDTHSGTSTGFYYHKDNSGAIEYDYTNENKAKVYYGYTENANVPPVYIDYSGTSIFPKWLIIAKTDTLDKIYEINKGDYDESGCLGGINLGLFQREQPDLSIVKDVNKIDISVNGKTHQYNYNSRFKQEIQKENDFNNLGVQYKNKFTGSYPRPIYHADYIYNNTDQNKNLKVYITYQIKIINESSSLKSTVNSIKDYYDSNYTLISASTKDGNDLEKTEISAIKDEKTKEILYKGQLIKTSDIGQIEAGKSKDIYVKFELNKSAIGEIIEKGENLDNYVEINSYSTYDKVGNRYAGFDKDSIVGNMKPEITSSYEDDSDFAPGIKLSWSPKRTMTGKVFLDDSSASGGIGETRQGDGKYKEGELGISGVTVKLKEISGSGQTYTATTDSNGDFYISDYIPGDYILIYTWGGQTYTLYDKQYTITVQDYKGTVVDKDSYEAKGIGENKDSKWYKHEFKKKYPNVEWDNQKNKEIRVSDATDDYDKRIKIDETKDETPTTMDSTTDDYVKRIKIDETKDETPTTMDSTTPIMEMGVEYKYEDVSDALQEKNTVFNITSIDFGIVERARQQIDISKKVKTVKITLANGQTIVDAEVIIVKGDVNGDGIITIKDVSEINKYLNGTKEIEYELKGERKGVNYIGPSKNAIPKNGYFKIEIDNELIQGSTIEIGYEIIVKNNSEVDYDSPNYYKYGYKEGNIVTIKPKVYDYLEINEIEDIVEEKNENGGWTTIKPEKYEEDIAGYKAKRTIIENYFSSIKNLKIQDENGKEKILDITGYPESYEEYYSKITEWSSENVQDARQKRLENKKILHNENLEYEFKPVQSKTASLYVTKVLANSDEIELNNDVEITQIERATKTGRKVTPTSSTFYDKGETVTVTPATGENRDYTSIIVLVISSFIILGTGIVFIKKKILG